MLTQTARPEAHRGLSATALLTALALGSAFSADAEALSFFTAEASFSATNVPAGLDPDILNDQSGTFTTGTGLASADTDLSLTPGALTVSATVNGMGGLDVGSGRAFADVTLLFTPSGDAVDVSGETLGYSVGVSLTTNNSADEAGVLAGAGVFRIDVATNTVIETVFLELLQLSTSSGSSDVAGSYTFENFILSPGEGLALEVVAFGVPEPGPLLLLGSGLLLLANRRCRVF